VRIPPGQGSRRWVWLSIWPRIRAHLGFIPSRVQPRSPEHAVVLVFDGTSDREGTDALQFRALLSRQRHASIQVAMGWARRNTLVVRSITGRKPVLDAISHGRRV